MQTKIFCKTVAEDVQAYYVTVDGKTYFLFEQAYYSSNNRFFRNGVTVDKSNDYSVAHSASVRKTMDKLPAYIRFIEKEYGVAIYDKTRKARQTKHRKPYSRKSGMHGYDEWDVA